MGYIFKGPPRHSHHQPPVLLTQMAKGEARCFIQLSMSWGRKHATIMQHLQTWTRHVEFKLQDAAFLEHRSSSFKDWTFWSHFHGNLATPLKATRNQSQNQKSFFWNDSSALSIHPSKLYKKTHSFFMLQVLRINLPPPPLGCFRSKASLWRPRRLRRLRRGPGRGAPQVLRRGLGGKQVKCRPRPPCSWKVGISLWNVVA